MGKKWSLVISWYYLGFHFSKGTVVMLRSIKRDNVWICWVDPWLLAALKNVCQWIRDRIDVFQIWVCDPKLLEYMGVDY